MSKEGSTEAPIRHPINFEDPDFLDPKKLDDEMRRVFDICHGCRRCFNLCDSFPKLFDIIDSVEDMHFMLQLEVVQLLTASPGEKAWGRLAILAQYHCEVTHLFNVPPTAFKPIPKVQSAVVRLKPLQQKPFQHVESLALSNATRLAFSQRRKTLRNNLKSVIDVDRLKDIEINPEARAETLTLRQFVKLAEFIHSS